LRSDQFNSCVKGTGITLLVPLKNKERRDKIMSIRIILADDHAMVRHVLNKSFQEEEDFEVIAQAEDGLSSVKLASELSPDVVVMDIGMSNLNGIEATRHITRDCPQVKVIALSMHSGSKYVTEMFKAGASGYLLKNCDFEELADAVRIVVKGKTHISPCLSDLVIQDHLHVSAEEDSAFSVLTRREREVLQLLAEGKTTKQVAFSLCVSPKTVETHRLNIMNKLETDTIAGLTKYAIQEGLILLEY
jgi:two-component system response regulator NreC